MKRSLEICSKCRRFFNGDCSDGVHRYAFCNYKDEESIGFYIAVAQAQPNATPEDDYFSTEHDEWFFNDCLFRAEYLLHEYNDKEP